MIDVLLFQDSDGGNLAMENGVLVEDSTVFTAAFISLWGGNIEDKGSTASRSQMWWANFDEPDLDQHIRSKTQALLIALPAITSSLLRVEEAAESDLAWMLSSEIAESVSATASLPARNTVRLLVQIQGKDGPYTFDFTRPWPPTAS